MRYRPDIPGKSGEGGHGPPPHDRADYDPVGPSEDDPDIRRNLLRVWGYKWLILSVVALGVGSTWLVVQDIVPRYTATAILLIAPPEKNVIEIEDVVEGLDSQEDTIESEEEVLKSREMASKAIEKLGLFHNRRFSSKPEKASFFSHLNPVSYVPKIWKEGISEFVEDPKLALFGNPSSNGISIEIPLYEELDKIRRDRIINTYLGGLKLIRAPRSRVIRISFTFEDPRLAADAANQLADAYVRETLEIKYAGTREAAELINEQLEDLKEKVQKSEAAAEQLRQGEALVKGRSSQVISEQISAVNEQLLEARAETATLRGKLRQIEELRSGPNGSEDGNALFDSPMIQTLRLEKFRLEREEADLALELGSKHPKLVNRRAEISDIREKLVRELDKIAAAARNELTVAQQKEASIRQTLNNLTNEVGGLNEVEVQLRALEREAEANRSLYEAFLTRSKETSVQEELQQPDGRVISYAQIPQIPSYPPTQRFMMIALVVSSGVAAALVYLFERLDKGFRTGQQVEQQLGLRVLGLVPIVNSMKDNVKHPEDLLLRSEHS